MEIIIRGIRQRRSAVLRKNKELRPISFYVLIRDEKREHDDKLKLVFLLRVFHFPTFSIFKH